MLPLETMAISKGALGMNARNFIYIRKYNHRSAKRVADNKIRTKRILIRNDIPTTKLLAVFPNLASVRNFNWDLPPDGFVVKPARGYGGGGILVFKNWYKGEGEVLNGKIYTLKLLESHILDILDGAYSLQYLPDAAYIEEVVKTIPLFKKIVPYGLPDIRIIVFNGVPVMAMLRLPTNESEGKANLHIGAIGVGIELRTGITTHALLNGRPVYSIVGTKIKIGGIKIPDWEKVLKLAAVTQMACGLGYAGIDIVLDESRGPLVLEINARPGLEIQNVNRSSLRTRLERLENIHIANPQRGVELAKSLFAEPRLEKVDTSKPILSVIEEVEFNYGGNRLKTKAKIDTGALRTSLDTELVKHLGLRTLEKKILIKAASGQQWRRSIKVRFKLRGKDINTVATIAQRSHMQYPLIVGRRDLKGFLVNPEIKEDPDSADEYTDQDLEE